MNRNQKLELTWIGKEHRPKLEPRILIEEPEKSSHAAHRVTDHDIFDNRLIFGDNLLALKALEQEFTKTVKCVFIDPPYNTGSAFEHYEDGVEHSIWLSMMRERLELLRRLLTDDGSIWITIDDNEAHYLKVLCDEVFGRSNFVASFVWQKTLTRRNDARVVSVAHDYVLTYARDSRVFRLNRLDADERKRATYTNRDNDPRGDWLAIPFHAPNIRPNLTYPITTPSGRVLLPPQGRCWSTTKEHFEELRADGRIYFGRNGNGMAQRKKFWEEDDKNIVAWTWWPYEETGENREANREAKDIAEECGIETVFETPKPERLLRRIIHIATDVGDLILDSFAGSGTTGAVAQKMHRRWIMIEVHGHCDTHIVPRLKKVIDGQDPGGVTEAAGWKGGGGFRYYRLAPSLLARDKWGNWVISKAYNASMLAEAVCKLEGFRYLPSDAVYWQHGHSTERDFIYVTTQHFTHEQLLQVTDEVGPERSLLIMCTAFRGKADAYPNLTIKRIPRTVLSRCEWGRDDYSLEVANLGAAPPDSGQQDLGLEK
ncbi:MAG: site-specific DNA-methyltransferase [Vicinamibacterales bacterium]